MLAKPIKKKSRITGGVRSESAQVVTQLRCCLRKASIRPVITKSRRPKSTSRPLSLQYTKELYTVRLLYNALNRSTLTLSLACGLRSARKKKTIFF